MGDLRLGPAVKSQHHFCLLGLDVFRLAVESTVQPQGTGSAAGQGQLQPCTIDDQVVLNFL